MLMGRRRKKEWRIRDLINYEGEGEKSLAMKKEKEKREIDLQLWRAQKYYQLLQFKNNFLSFNYHISLHGLSFQLCN